MSVLTILVHLPSYEHQKQKESNVTFLFLADELQLCELYAIQLYEFPYNSFKKIGVRHDQ